MVSQPPCNSREESFGVNAPSRYRGLPVAFMRTPGGETVPCPYLLTPEELIDFLRLHESHTRFPKSTIARYRRLGLRTVRVGRRTWYALPDVLDFLDGQQTRLRTRRR